MRIIKTVYKGLVSIPQNIPGGVIMKRKAFTLTLAAFLLASLAACSNGTNSSKTANETTSAVETSVSENAHSDIIRICQDFLQNNETDETLASTGCAGDEKSAVRKHLRRIGGRTGNRSLLCGHLFHNGR